MKGEIDHMDKQWRITYRQFARSRRDIKSVVVAATSQVEAKITFNMALMSLRRKDPARYGTTAPMYIFKEV